MMKLKALLAVSGLGSVAHALSLGELCTKQYAKAALPVDSAPEGLTIDPSSVTVSVSYNQSASSVWFPDSVISYCNITFAYSHDGIPDDKVQVTYWAPAPSEFKNRYLSTGGGGFAINSGSGSVPAGIIVGAVAGLTDGGFGSFNTQSDAVFLLANGTINWQALYMFGYQAQHELAVLGKELSRNLYNLSGSDKIYSYYQGCSEGGREGWSQVQRYADQFDGAVVGAPAFRFSHQQINHLAANVIEQTLEYFPPPCELEKINNLTISACDKLDGRVDGVISRSDLCKLEFDINSTIGEPYSCAASTGGSGGAGGPTKRQFGGGSPSPAQNGTVSAKGVAVAKAILDGLHDSEGHRIYFNYQPGAGFSDAQTTYDDDSDSWELSINQMGGEFVTRYLRLQNTSTLASLDNVTANTLRDWMTEGMNRYYDSLQTTYPDLSPFASAGGKVLHLHGEQDNSIPTASSVRYYESVRSIMYGHKSEEQGVAALDDFYRLFLVPGGAHCGTNQDQPNGGWPDTTLETVIRWVEEGKAPSTLSNAAGTIDKICRWPLRPLWKGNGTELECVHDQKSINSWKYNLDAFKVPVY